MLKLFPMCPQGEWWSGFVWGDERLCGNRVSGGAVIRRGGDGQCEARANALAQDKAIKRYSVKNMVEAAAVRDLSDASAYKEYALPKLYIRLAYCISCAIHAKSE